MQFRLNNESIINFNSMQMFHPSEAIKAGIATTIIPIDAVAARRDVLTSTKKFLK